MIAFWTLLLLFLVLFVAGPWWPYSRGWGFTPAGVVLAALLMWLLIIWFGWFPFLWPWTPAVLGPDLP